jgi:hypothetical protein
MNTVVSHESGVRSPDEALDSKLDTDAGALGRQMWNNDQRLAETQVSRDECLGLLRTTRVGRVALSIDALPVVLPVGFALLGENIVLRCLVDSPLSRSGVDVVLAFQVDNFDAATQTGWSVLVQGMASEVDDPEAIERCQALTLPVSGVALGCARFARMTTANITGRRVASVAR